DAGLVWHHQRRAALAKTEDALLSLGRGAADKDKDGDQEDERQESNQNIQPEATVGGRLGNHRRHISAGGFVRAWSARLRQNWHKIRVAIRQLHNVIGAEAPYRAAEIPGDIARTNT